MCLVPLLITTITRHRQQTIEKDTSRSIVFKIGETRYITIDNVDVDDNISFTYLFRSFPKKKKKARFTTLNG